MKTDRSQHGLILPMTLLIIALLSILSASFAFQTSARRSAVNVVRKQTQLRMTADAGIHHALLLLRENRYDSSLWYDNEPLFHNRVVWSRLGDRAEIDVSEEIDPTSQTLRYSLVADDPNDDLVSVRYGITDESSKLNINFATRAQLTTLFSHTLSPDAPIAALVDALTDWRDQDSTPGADGAEADYYLTLDPPYQIKNNLFETVEELLLVRGFTAQVLFGEDVDRNGLLTPNEDDGELTFPLDNQDGTLQRGIYPYLTVWSRDLNRSNDNINRIDLNLSNAQQLEEELTKYFEDDLVDYIVTARRNDITFSGPVQLLGHAYAPQGLGGEEGDASEQNMESPVTLEHLPLLCDRTTAIRQPGLMGLININTAPREVLRCLVNDIFTEEDIEVVLAARQYLEGEKLTTVAWLLTEGVISQPALESIYAQITARGQQFHIESIGYADDFGMRVRLQAIVELRGHVPQFMYYRDLTELGTAYPIRGTREGGDLVRHRRR